MEQQRRALGALLLFVALSRCAVAYPGEPRVACSAGARLHDERAGARARAPEPGAPLRAVDCRRRRRRRGRRPPPCNHQHRRRAVAAHRIIQSPPLRLRPLTPPSTRHTSKPPTYTDLWDGYSGTTCAHPDDSEEHVGHEGAITYGAPATFTLRDKASDAIVTQLCPGKTHVVSVTLPRQNSQDPHMCA